MDKKHIKKIVYTGVVLDLFHYGHLQLLKFANSLGDYHVCGILTDEAVKSYRGDTICSLEERKEVLSNLNFIDRIVIQDKLDPTDNLKEIKKEFEDAEIVLVHGTDWEIVPGQEYINQINGKLIKHPYYKKLSNFNILNTLFNNHKKNLKGFDDFTQHFKIKDFIEVNKNIRESIISTKANTLKTLGPILKKSKIEKSFVFTTLDWDKKKNELIDQINKEFNSETIVVRSSAINEDTLNSSLAGYFHTELNVDSDNKEKIESAISKVVNSYENKKLSNLSNQVIVQTQTKDIKLSGVILTRTLENLPYYVINYDDQSQDTDTVTKGVDIKTVKISRFCNNEDYPKLFSNLLSAVKEIENIIEEMSLDIEFAINNKDEVVIFQVRPLVYNTKNNVNDSEIKKRIEESKQIFNKLSEKNHLVGEKNFFCDMPDWNPAEIIGDSPNILDYSLYDYIITDDVWHKARSSQGYFDVGPAKLVVLFGNKPYINVRNSFNSFIPNSISKDLREKLIAFYLVKLEKNPEFQDKVEFDVLYTCYDFSFDSRSKELLEFGFTQDEVNTFKKSLLDLTNNLISNSKKEIEEDLVEVNKLDRLRNELSYNKEDDLEVSLNKVKMVLDNCKSYGTLQFSRLARLAFIGKILLKSLVNKKIINESDYQKFLGSINTVATEINNDFILLKKGDLDKNKFLIKYGHLRPGTYDITCNRYESNPDLLKVTQNLPRTSEKKLIYSLDKDKLKLISDILKREGFNFDSEFLFNFIKSTLEIRELSKYEFTKSLSDSIEIIAKAGERLGFSREEISQLDIFTITDVENLNDEQIKERWDKIINLNSENRQLNKGIILPPTLFSEKDFDIISYYNAKPNFITHKKVQAEIINLKEISGSIPDLTNKIVVLENGDPGYDWIFTRNPAGLITKYGGVASHMSIRCSEFELPAAIGCGEQIFNEIKNSSSVLLDCESGKIKGF